MAKVRTIATLIVSIEGKGLTKNKIKDKISKIKQDADKQVDDLIDLEGPNFIIVRMDEEDTV
jgi:hypothetical protein